MCNKPKLIRITTISKSLGGLLKGQMGFMSNYFEVKAITANDDRVDHIAKQEGVEIMTVSLKRQISLLHDLRALIKIYQILQKEKPTIVHTHTPKAGLLGMIAAFFARVPHRLHTVAGMPLLVATGIKRWLLNTMEKLTYRCATFVYPNSYGLKEIILENKFTKSDKLKVIGNGSSNGVDTAYFNPDLYDEDFKKNFRKELTISPNDFVYVFVGRLVTDKGINELVEAFVQINKAHQNTKLLLVGGYEKHLDPLKLQTEQLIENHPNIKAVGSQREVRPYFAVANVLAFPSYREGFPNVVMQACALNINVIATNINGCNELIKDNHNGFLVPAANVEQLKEKMLLVYTHPAKNHSMGSKNRQLMKDKFERKVLWNELLKEYEKVINNTFLT